MIKIIIPLATPSLNGWYSGMYWRKRNAQSTEWHTIVKNEVKKQKIKPITKFPVSITTQSFYKKKGKVKDTSNAFPANKLIEDGLVKSGILPNDTIKYVSEHHILTPQFNTGEDKVIVWIDKIKEG